MFGDINMFYFDSSYVHLLLPEGKFFFKKKGRWFRIEDTLQMTRSMRRRHVLLITWGKGRDNRRASLRLLACEKATSAAAGCWPGIGDGP